MVPVWFRPQMDTYTYTYTYTFTYTYTYGWPYALFPMPYGFGHRWIAVTLSSVRGGAELR